MNAGPLATPTALLPSQRIKKKSSAQRKLETPLSTDGERRCMVRMLTRPGEATAER
jgi:hypothetical protein